MSIKKDPPHSIITDPPLSIETDPPLPVAKGEVVGYASAKGVTSKSETIYHTAGVSASKAVTTTKRGTFVLAGALVQVNFISTGVCVLALILDGVVYASSSITGFLGLGVNALAVYVDDVEAGTHTITIKDNYCSNSSGCYVGGGGGAVVV